MKLYWRNLNLAGGRKIAKQPNQNHYQINYVYGNIKVFMIYRTTYVGTYLYGTIHPSCGLNDKVSE